MEQVIDKAATGLGDGVAVLADSGALFVVFGLLWAAFAVALMVSQGSLDAAWQVVRGWPLAVEAVVWLLFLPVMAGMWVWESAWPLLVRLTLVAGLTGWTLLVFPKPWR
jgi:hypothetical protein